jgi:Dos2-interacting transcription regulator of RNA-Pol-II
LFSSGNTFQAVDEEKDPNNLVLIFSCWPIILTNFDLEPLTEDVFDTMACYFPIDFTPPSGLYGAVTREELIQVPFLSTDYPLLIFLQGWTHQSREKGILLHCYLDC